MVSPPYGVENMTDPHALLEHKEKMDRLRRALWRLSSTRAQVIRWRFGIGCDEKTRPEISALTGLSVYYITKVEKKALKEINRYLKEE
jgi:DNA-directed RNA polymerase specialized sigma subunit